MRYGTIRALQNAGQKMDRLLYRQFEFLDTRMQAYENVLNSRWGLLRAARRFPVFPPKGCKTRLRWPRPPGGP